MQLEKRGSCLSGWATYARIELQMWSITVDSLGRHLLAVYCERENTLSFVPSSSIASLHSTFQSRFSAFRFPFVACLLFLVFAVLYIINRSVDLSIHHSIGPSVIPPYDSSIRAYTDRSEYIFKSLCSCFLSITVSVT